MGANRWHALCYEPVKQHQVANGNLYIAFNNAITPECQACSVFMPLDWKINEKTVVQPDLMLVCKEFNTDFLEFAPTIVVEILSPSTALKDRNEKYELYEQEGVRYYLIVDTKFKKIEVYELVDGKYQPVSINPQQFTFHLDGGCQIIVDFQGIWG